MEERFVLDNNNNVIDFEDKTDKYCLSQEDVCNLLNKQQQRIAELEQDLEFTTKTANELIEIKHKLEQELNSKNMLCENYNCGLNKKIQQLEQELAELKEKAIVKPKFKHFEEYWYIENNPYCDNELQVFNGKIMEIICAYDEDWLYEYRFDTSCRYIEEDNIFVTEQEALNKLKEIQGNE